MKRNSFNERVANCMAQFRDVETRCAEQGDRYTPRNHPRQPAKAETPPPETDANAGVNALAAE